MRFSRAWFFKLVIGIVQEIRAKRMIDRLCSYDRKVFVSFVTAKIPSSNLTSLSLTILCKTGDQILLTAFLCQST